MPEKNNTNPKENLLEAVKLVQKAIEAERKKYEKIADNYDASPVMVEGSTSAGYFAQTHADPSDIARIFTNYDYAMFRILEEDVPQGMWDDIARLVGFESVSCVDI